MAYTFIVLLLWTRLFISFFLATAMIIEGVFLLEILVGGLLWHG